MQEINFYKNMAMAGGFLYVAAFGARAWSLDAWRAGRRRAMAARPTAPQVEIISVVLT